MSPTKQEIPLFLSLQSCDCCWLAAVIAVASFVQSLLALLAPFIIRLSENVREVELVASVTVRNLPEGVRKRLRQRAARAGHSMEAEIRKILTDASLAEEREASSQGLREWVERLYRGRKPTGVVDDLIAERRRQAASE